MKTIKIQESVLDEAIEDMAYKLYGEDSSRKVQLYVFEDGSIKVSNSMDFNSETLWHSGCSPVFTFSERCSCISDQTEEEKLEMINQWTSYLHDSFWESESILDDYCLTIEFD